MIGARFDDLRTGRRRSFELVDPIGVIEARRVSEVRTALQHVEAAVHDGQWVAGWVSYEAAPAFDPAFQVNDLADGPFADLPLVWFGVFDRRTTAPEPLGTHRIGRWTPTVTAEEHAEAVAVIRRRITAGDTYQVNHTFRMHAPFSGSIRSLYDMLSRAQSCGYGAMIESGRWAIASASPELFFEWRHGRLISKPMKGTAGRGLDLTSDEEHRHRLRTSEKEQAENLMIVDMVRNDMSRVAVSGSVQVPELFTTEKYDTVWQLTSTVTSRTRPDVTLEAVFAALFPCASITGAPKVATTAIITELEADARGVYCGAIGFGGPGPAGPEWAFNVGIRTVLLDELTATAWYGTGGGVTYDSTPQGEYTEALLKAAFLERKRSDFGLIETMFWSPETGLRDVDRHLGRLSDSALYFDIPLDAAEVRAELGRATAGLEEKSRIRLNVDRSGRVETTIAPAPDPPSRPVRIVIDTVPVPVDDPFLRHKTTNRRVHEAARSRHPDVDDVIEVDSSGHITETTIASLAVLIDDEWRTPPIESGCLSGVARAVALDAGRMIEKPVSVGDVRRATEVWRLNSLRGWERCVLVGDDSPAFGG